MKNDHNFTAQSGSHFSSRHVLLNKPRLQKTYCSKVLLLAAVIPLWLLFEYSNYIKPSLPCPCPTWLQKISCFLWLTFFSPKANTYPLGSLLTNRNFPHDFHGLLRWVVPLPTHLPLMHPILSCPKYFQAPLDTVPDSINPLSPSSDQDQISANNIHTLSRDKLWELIKWSHKRNALIYHQILSTHSLRKCIEISLENLYVDTGA